MALNTKAINRRIKSVGNTRKITKAMEMVAAAKMRRAVAAALETRSYARLAWNFLVNLSRTEKNSSPLLAVRPVNRLLVILVTSNRGLCGSFNSNIIKKTAQQLRNPKNISRQRIDGADIEATETFSIDVVGVGKKGAEFAKKMEYNLIASFSHFTDTPELSDVMPISRMVIEDYEAMKYDKIVIAYTDYKSPLFQEAKLRQVLPISEIDLEKTMKDIDSTLGIKQADCLGDFVFEPDKMSVLQSVLPRLVEMQIYQSILESAASEHSSRMMAMRNASDAARDMISELNLNYNKARQSGITQEISEIAGGAAALE